MVFDELRFATGWGGELFTSTNTLTPLPDTPTHLAWNVSGTNLDLTWPSNYVGWVLQMQTNSSSTGLSTNWVNVSESVSNSQWRVPQQGAGAIFFRLSRP